MALRVLGQIADEMESRFGVRRIAIVHRTGEVPLGEPSIAILTCSPHRSLKGAPVVARGALGGRQLFFGVREHGMGSVMVGMAEGGLLPFGGTFFVFSDYMRPAVRVAALSGTAPSFAT